MSFIFSILYSLVQMAKPGDPTAPRKFYGRNKNRGDINLRQLSKDIELISTVSSIDNLAVMEAMLRLIPTKLMEGNIVRLGEFGTFYLNMSSEGVENEDDFTVAHIKGVKVNFRPGKEILNALKSAEFEKA